MREMLEAMRLARVLRRSASSVPNRGVVTNMASRPAMSGYLGGDSLEAGGPVVPAHDDRLARVDPDKGRRPSRRSVHVRGCHDRAHAGRVSLSTARSA